MVCVDYLLYADSIFICSICCYFNEHKECQKTLWKIRKTRGSSPEVIIIVM